MTHWKLWELPVMYGPRKPVSGRRALNVLCGTRVVKAVRPSARNARRRALAESFTDLLSRKQLDVELRRLQFAALREKRPR